MSGPGLNQGYPLPLDKDIQVSDVPIPWFKPDICTHISMGCQYMQWYSLQSDTAAPYTTLKQCPGLNQGYFIHYIEMEA